MSTSTVLTGVSLCLFSLVLQAAPLTGASGTLAVPTSTGTEAQIPGVTATITNTGFPPRSTHTGTWAAPANGAWHGTYTGNARVPISPSTSPVTLDFTSLNMGYLPMGTFVILGDLDTLENLTLIGYGAGGALLTSHWLSEPVFLGGSNPSQFVSAFMPTWTFNTLTGQYAFVGEGATGNPNFSTVLQTTTNLSKIDITKNNNLSFSLNAQATPEPASYVITGLGLVAVGLARWRRSIAPLGSVDRRLLGTLRGRDSLRRRPGPCSQ